MVRIKQFPTRRPSQNANDRKQGQLTVTIVSHVHRAPSDPSKDMTTETKIIAPETTQGTAATFNRSCLPITLLINMMSFQKWVKRIFQEMFKDTVDYRMTSGAMGALQESAEAYAVSIFEDADVCRSLSNRVTVMQSDIRLSHRLRKRN